MRCVTLLAAFALVACGGPTPLEDAKDRLAFLEKHGADRDEICRAKQAVAEAALDERSEDYRLLKADADIECRSAALGI